MKEKRRMGSSAPVDKQQKKAPNQKQRSPHVVGSEFFNRVNDAAIVDARTLINILFLINGGAAVSTLAFIGGLLSQKIIKLNELGPIAESLTYFAVGAALAGVTAALAYLTNYCVAETAKRQLNHLRPNNDGAAFVDPDHLNHIAHTLGIPVEQSAYPFFADTLASKHWRRAANGVRILAMIVAATSLGMFVYGTLTIKFAIMHFPA